jgi:hypothetical protein
LGLVLVSVGSKSISLEQKTRVGGGAEAGDFRRHATCDRCRPANATPAVAACAVSHRPALVWRRWRSISRAGDLELVLVPAFIVLSDVPFGSRPGPLLLIAALGNVGFAAAGTLVGGLTSGLRHRGGLLTLLLLPLVVPVVFGAAETTRLLLSGQIDSLWWRWIQLLAVFAAVFTVAGAMLFEFVVED